MIYVIIGAVALALFFLAKQTTSAAPGVSSKSYLEGLINVISKSIGVDSTLVKAIAEVESSFNPSAKNPSDPSYGLCGISPALASDYGYIKNWENPSSFEIGSIYDVSANITIASKHLRRLLSSYPWDTAIQMYNVGETGFNKGKRNLDYLNKVRAAYDKYCKEG